MNNKFKIMSFLGAEKNYNSSFISKIKGLVYMLFFVTYDINVINKDSNAEYAFICTKQREDYWKFFEKIYFSCQGNKVEYKVTQKKHFSFNLLFLAFKYISFYKDTRFVSVPQRKDSKITYQKTKNNLYTRIFTFLRFINCVSMVKKLDKTGFFNVSKLVILSDAWAEENILLEYAKHKGIYVICCQHALFFEGENISFDTMNYIENTADKYLLWGKPTAKLLNKYNKHINCKACGNPIIKPVNKSCIDKRDISLWNIILDQPSFHEYNQRMITVVEEAAKNRGAHIQLRLHPAEREKENTYVIDNEVSSFNLKYDNYGISIGHTSTMLYTQLLAGYPVFRYKTDIEIVFNPELCFSNLQELDKLLSNINNADYVEEGKKFIAYIGSESEEQYKMAFDELK